MIRLSLHRSSCYRSSSRFQERLVPAVWSDSAVRWKSSRTEESRASNSATSSVNLADKDAVPPLFAKDRRIEQKQDILQTFFANRNSDKTKRAWDPRSTSSTRPTSKLAQTLRSPRSTERSRVDPLEALQTRRDRQRPGSSSDPTDVSKLRSALFGNQQRAAAPPPRPAAPLPKAPPSRDPPNPPASANYQSPLTEVIRRIQLEQEERARAREKDQLNLASPSTASTPLPKWRLVDKKSLRDLRRQHDPRRGPARADFGPEEHVATKRPVPVNQQEQLVVLPSYDVSLTEASLLFREKASKLRRILRGLGVIGKDAPVHDEDLMIESDALELVAVELGQNFERATRQSAPSDEELLLQRRAAAEAEAAAVEYESLPPRPPVVTVMGHVDHGKTTLMDALRARSHQADENVRKAKKSKKDQKKAKKSGGFDGVAGTEAGGITQVISAFQVPLADHDDVAVTFLDTPGHAAFKAMRQSGSDAADVIVLVVAADDGVSEQTIEIINFYKSIVQGAGNGGISMVVAMNKIDKPGIDVHASRMRIESQLLEHGILVEGMPVSDKSAYGPPVQLVPVSGLTGEGLDDLIEALTLQTEIMDLRADDSSRGEGIVMDARVDKGLGIVADCVVRWGSLSKGDIVVSGTNIGKIRILKDMNDKPLVKGLPSQPVRIVGFESVPKAGEPIVSVESEEIAEDLVARRKAAMASSNDMPETSGDAELQSSGKHMMHDEWKVALETKYGLEDDGKEAPIRIPVIVKADADGTLAAIRDALVLIGNESKHNVVIEPVRLGVGPVLAIDVQTAKEGGATIICFNLKNEQTIKKLAEEEDVALIGHDVIYSLLDKAKEEFAKYLPPEPVEIVHGRAQVKAVFDIGGVDEKVAGLQITDGTFFKDKAKIGKGTFLSQYRVVRDGKVVTSESATIRATSLKHFKEDVVEIGRGKECGLSLSVFSDFREGDTIECFSIEMKREFI